SQAAAVRAAIGGADSAFDPDRPSVWLAAAVALADAVEPITLRLEGLTSPWRSDLNETRDLLQGLMAGLVRDLPSTWAEELHDLVRGLGEACKDVELSLRESSRKIARLARTQTRLGLQSKRILDAADCVALGSTLADDWDRALSRVIRTRP